MEIFHAKGGVDDAYAVAVRRSGRWFDPDLVKALGAFRRDTAFWASLAEPDLTRWEPEDQMLTVDAEREIQIATAFAAIVDAKSPWTYFHSDRTSLIATNVGAALGLDAAELGALRRVGLLHDIGKLAVSNRILDKPGKLTEAEFARIKEHPLFTRWVLERVSCFEALAPVATAHHERLDGSGYPHGLRAEDLTMPMRVLAVADVYEALTAERPYRHALAEDDALGDHPARRAEAARRRRVRRARDGDRPAADGRLGRALGRHRGRGRRGGRGEAELPGRVVVRLARDDGDQRLDHVGRELRAGVVLAARRSRPRAAAPCGRSGRWSSR